MNQILKPLPKIGQEYHFFDDGKTSPSRHYICRVERIISIKESKTFFIKQNLSLFKIWLSEKKKFNFLYADKTDCFIEISCPKYDDNLLYCARTKDGGFFSMDTTSFWQSGRLDVDGKIFEGIINYWENCDNELAQIYLEQTY